jgi:hypothetical protein
VDTVELAFFNYGGREDQRLALYAYEVTQGYFLPSRVSVEESELVRWSFIRETVFYDHGLNQPKAAATPSPEEPQNPGLRSLQAKLEQQIRTRLSRSAYRGQRLPILREELTRERTAVHTRRGRGKA